MRIMFSGLIGLKCILEAKPSVGLEETKIVRVSAKVYEREIKILVHEMIEG